MVSFHVLVVKLLLALDADAALLFILFSFLVVCKGTDIEVLFLSVKEVGVNTSDVLHLIVLDKGFDLLFQFLGIIMIVVVTVVEVAPGLPLHLLTVVVAWKEHLNPSDDLSVVAPQFIGVFILLMGSHIGFDFTLVEPS